MNEEEYITTQQNLILLAQLLTQMDLVGFLAAIDRAEAVGPVMTPGLYREAGEKLGKVRRLAEAAQVFQREALRQMKDVKSKEGEE